MSTKQTETDILSDVPSSLIAVMVLISAADRNMTDKELFLIGELTKTLPAFNDYDPAKLVQSAGLAVGLIEQTGGLAEAVVAIRDALPSRFHETAYVLACDVAAADGSLQMEEIRALEILRDGLGIDRLTSAAIERAARARNMTVS